MSPNTSDPNGAFETSPTAIASCQLVKDDAPICEGTLNLNILTSDLESSNCNRERFRKRSSPAPQLLHDQSSLLRTAKHDFCMAVNCFISRPHAGPTSAITDFG